MTVAGGRSWQMELRELGVLKMFSNFILMFVAHQIRDLPSSIFAWRIPWTEEPGRLQSMGLQKD